jgi:hypothetical protein
MRSSAALVEVTLSHVWGLSIHGYVYVAVGREIAAAGKNMQCTAAATTTTQFG